MIRLVQKKHPHLSYSKIRRVYEREGFSLYRRLKRRVKQEPANPITIPLIANEEWAMDFMSDSLKCGRKFPTLNVIDHFNRSCKGMVVAYSLPALSVTEQLERIIEAHDKPKRMRTEMGRSSVAKSFSCG